MLAAMDWQQMADIFSRMPAPERQRWMLLGVGLLALMLAVLWLEARHFQRRQQLRGWARVRLVSLVSAPLSVAVLLAPALAVSGPAALGVFILSLYMTAPLVWFGSHLWAGRGASPPLSVAQSLGLGLSGLAVLSIPVFAYLMAEGPLHAAAREIGLRRQVPADNPSLQHTVHPVRRHTLPGVGVLYSQSLQGGSDMRLLRVEQRKGGQWPEHPTAHPAYCTHGNDIHLLWPADEQPPYLRLEWAQANSATVRAEFTPDLGTAAAAEPAALTATFRDDGLDPSVAIPRARAILDIVKPGQSPYTQLLGNPPGVGEVWTTDCVMAGFTTRTPGPDWSVQSISLVVYPPLGGPPRVGTIAR